MSAPSDLTPSPVDEQGRVPATRLELAGQALLDDEKADWRVEVSAPGVLGLRSPSGRILLLDDAPDDPSRLAFALDRVRQKLYPARQVVVLGEATLRQRLEAHAIELEGLEAWFHCADGSFAWENREPRRGERRVVEALRAAAAAAFSRRHWSQSEAGAHARRVELDRMLTRAEARDVERYRRVLSAKPRATIALVGLILSVFGLQALWGGIDLPPLLTRMGSLVPERALNGEWWRFVACTFLHGGFLHVALNTLVLWMLGRSLEPFIGTARFAFIYFMSGLAGSAASSWFVTSQSVGASGAIWGLLGAHAALAFYPRPLLPPALVATARRAAGTNLALNLVNSFNPHVDAAAHVGGGLMGALMLIVLALSGSLSTHGRAAPPSGPGLRAVAALLAATFVLGSARGIVAGRPWQLDSAPELARVELPGSPWSVEVPRGQATHPAADGRDSIEFGNLAHDPALVDISWVRLSNGSSGREPHAELSMILRQLATVPDGLEELVPPRIVQDRERPARSHVAVRYRYASNADVVNDRVIGVIDGHLVRVDVIAWAALPRAFDGLATRISRSIEPLAASTAALQPDTRRAVRSLRADSRSTRAVPLSAQTAGDIVATRRWRAVTYGRRTRRVASASSHRHAAHACRARHSTQDIPRSAARSAIL